MTSGLEMECDYSEKREAKQTSKQCTYTVSQKKCHYFYGYNLVMHESILIILGRNITENVRSQSLLYFPPHLTSASALPGETGNPEIASFHLNVACCFANKHKTH